MCTSTHVQVNSPIRSTTNRIWVLCCQLESILTASSLHEREDCYFEQRGFVRVKLCMDWRFPILQNMALKHSVGSGRSYRHHQNQYNKLCDRTDIKPIKHMPVLNVNALDISTQPCGSCDFHGPGYADYEVYLRSYTRNAVYTENRCLGSACPVYIINTSILVTVWC